MLQDAMNKGTGTAAKINRPSAGKTGTTDNYQDAWFAGYTPDLVTIVWMGCDNNDAMPGITGGTTPARIWKSFMANALTTPAKNFDGSANTAVDNAITSVEEKEETTGKYTPKEHTLDEIKQEQLTDEVRDKILEEERNPSRHKHGNAVDNEVNPEPIAPPEQDIPAPSIEQGKGLN